MSELHELLHFMKYDGVAEMQERARRIDTEFHGQTRFVRDAIGKFGCRFDVIATGGENLGLLFRRGRG
jgi:hypothetical protein